MNICRKCGTEVEGEAVLKGCPNCGSKYFKFIDPNAEKRKAERLEELEKLEEEKRKKAEYSLDENSIESIKVENKGIYEVNLSQVLDGDTEIYSDKEGHYAIDLNSLLKKGREKDEK